MPELGLGTATLGRETNEEDSLRILDAAFALGFRHFDSAEAYGGGNARLYRKTKLGIDDERETTGTMHSSEIILGRWVRERGIRKQVTLATKVSSGFRQDEVEGALNRSLERMQLEYTDLYYLHSFPTNVAIEKPLSALEKARQQGRVGATGVCNGSIAQVMDAHRVSPMIAYCQNAFNLAQAEQSRPVLDYCQNEGIQFVGYSPLAAGFLTGKYGARGEAIPAGTRFDVIPGHQDIYFREESFEALARLEAASALTGLPKHLLALAWVLRNAAISIVLVGATRIEHLENALRARDLSLDEEIWRRLG